MILNDLEGYKYIIAHESLDDPEFPPNKGVVWAFTIISGYALKVIS